MLRHIQLGRRSVQRLLEGCCVRLCVQQQCWYAKKTKEQHQIEDRQLQMFVECLTPKEVKPWNLAPDEEKEWNERAKHYSRLKMAEHRAWQKDLTTKLKLKIAALKALPPDLQEEAAAEDDTPFPLNRQMFTHTPPIPGFQEQQQQASRRQGSRRLGTRQ